MRGEMPDFVNKMLVKPRIFIHLNAFIQDVVDKVGLRRVFLELPEGVVKVVKLRVKWKSQVAFGMVLHRQDPIHSKPKPAKDASLLATEAGRKNPPS